jgi:hypothetical protein
MKAVAIVLAVILSLGMMVGVSAVGMYVTYANKGVQFETRLNATYDENKVVLNNYTTKVQEIAQVPDMFKNDLEDVIEATFQGRYGENGSQAVFQWIQEQNMSLDPMLYRQIQQVMEAGRNEFAASQKQLIDVKRNYEAALSYVWSGFWLDIAGYPKVDLDDFKIVTLGDVDQKFESGTDSVNQLR